MRLLTFVIALVISQSLLAQEYVQNSVEKFPIPTSATEIIVQPLSVIGGGFELGVDRKFNLNNGFRLILGLYGTENPTSYEDASSFWGYKIDAHYKLILDNRAGKSHYAEYYTGFFATYRAITLTKQVNIENPNGTSSSSDLDFAANSACFGVMIGAKSTLFKRLNVDMYGGVGYVQRLSDRAPADEVHIPIVNPYQRGPMLKFGVAFGYLAKMKTSTPKSN